MTAPLQLHIGMRVRIIWSKCWPHLAGELGWVVAKAEPHEDDSPGIGEFEVAPDCWGEQFAPENETDGGMIFVPNPDQLAKVYDGDTPVAWSKCLWKPTGTRSRRPTRRSRRVTEPEEATP